ncbi:MAG: transcription repressor NadR [Clostridia bacterium]|nr:transcription repressor NadR [Clostridia bacterium]
MNSKQRREGIIETLSNSSLPIAGNQLAEKFNVSRQVIVQDIAILRAKGYEIIATPQGYLIFSENSPQSFSRIIASNHDRSGIEDELTTVVSYGGKVVNVIIEHEVYGELSGMIMVSSLVEVKKFVNDIKTKDAKPLSALTDGVHLHKIEADSPKTLDSIEAALKQKGYLL